MSRRKGALFLPLDVGFPDDDRIVEAGEQSAWLYVCMMLAAKRLGTDGVLSGRQIERLSVHDWRARLDRLVDLDLVAELESEVYTITAWFGHNDPIAVVVERRAKDAERKKGQLPNGIRTDSERTPDGVSARTPFAPSDRTPSVEKRREENRTEQQEPLLLDVVERAPAPVRDSERGPTPFDEFWSAYPRKVAKIDARKAYSKARKTATHEAIVAGAVRFASDRTRDQEFTPYPASWLNDGRWEDEGPVRPASSRPNASEQRTASTLALVEHFRRQEIGA